MLASNKTLIMYYSSSLSPFAIAELNYSGNLQPLNCESAEIIGKNGIGSHNSDRAIAHCAAALSQFYSANSLRKLQRNNL
jgi:hypothetical protein